jgi:hypothetical protein
VLIESGEATNMAIHEFALIRAVLARHETALTATRKSQKLTTAEIALINDIRNVVDTAEQRVEKEVADVTLAAQRL